MDKVIKKIKMSKVSLSTIFTTVRTFITRE